MEIIIANKSHAIYAKIICKTIADSANVRGTGIAKRTTDYIIQRMNNQNAVIALDEGNFVGFCYIEKWGHGRFVANSGLIVHPDYRGKGIAKLIKEKVFIHSRLKFPEAKVFSITTGLPVMKMNSDLGYKPVTFSELTKDQSFRISWKGSSEAPLHFIFRYKGDSVGRYRRYPLYFFYSRDYILNYRRIG